MNEIKVEPYIPDEDYDNPAMVVDFYEFTMANCLFLHGFKNTTLVFDMFFRKNPDNQGYSISAGQRKLTRFLLDYHFNEQDIHWLRTKGMSEEFCEYLRTYKWKGDMYALPEGTVCYPHVQMVRIECDLVGAILIETYLLQTMNFHSLIATKATRVTGLNTHTPRNVMEFGTRRAQGESAGNDGAYAAVLGGCIGTANCLAEMKFGAEVKAVGTVAHSFIEFFPTEFDAFKAFARFQKYNRLKNLSQGSLDFYAAKGRSFFRFLGDTEQPIHTITEETVEDYIFYMKDQQLHDTTINTNLRMVRAFLYWCMEKGYLEKYPIRLVRADDPIKEPYTTDELQKLLKEPDCKTCSFAEYRN